ncbi:MAG: Ig-like domain-containing protein, partial [Polyangiales bacterium]
MTPAEAAIGVGQTQQFKASLVVDSQESDITADVDWSSSAEDIATIDENGLATAVANGETTIVASRGGVTSMAVLTVTDAKLTTIIVTPSGLSLAIGTTQRFTASGRYSDGTLRDLESGVTWNSSRTSTATINNDGVATAVAAGSTTIRATSSGVSGTTELRVTDIDLESLSIEPSSKTLAKGTTESLKAVAHFSDDSTQEVTLDSEWSSSDEAVATVVADGEGRGEVKGVATGTATITASWGGKSATATITVSDARLTSIVIDPDELTLPIGKQETLTATGQFSDGSPQDISSLVLWSTSDAAVASVSNAGGTRGAVRGLKTGTAEITASRGNVSAKITVTVSEAQLVSITVTPPNWTIASGTITELMASGKFSDNKVRSITSEVTWTSSDEEIAVVSNEDETWGYVQGLAQGQVTIEAKWGEITGSTSLTVSSATLVSLEIVQDDTDLPIGTEKAFEVVGKFSDTTSQDLTSQVTWTSSEPELVSVSTIGNTRGVAKALAEGSAEITASLSGVESLPVTVTAIAATLDAITVSPESVLLPLGATQALTASGLYTDGLPRPLTSGVTWTSGTTANVTVSPSGVVTAKKKGTSVITAAVGSVSGTVTVTVTDATLDHIEISPDELTLPKGRDRTYVARGIYSDGQPLDISSLVTWDTSNSDIATVSNDAGSRGKVYAKEAGTANITATYQDHTGTSPLTVTGATLESISVAPVNPSIANGTTVLFTATGRYSDTTTGDITASVTWTSGSPSIATIATGGSGAGTATAKAVGTSLITASLDGKTSEGSTLTVSDATLSEIVVSPGAPKQLPNGRTFQYTAQGKFSDGHEQDITSL